MNDAEMADAAIDLAEHVILCVPDGTTNLVASMGLAIALGVGLRTAANDLEAAIDAMCDIVRQTARGERTN